MRILVVALVTWAVVATIGLAWLSNENSARAWNADAVFLNRMGDDLSYADGLLQTGLLWRNATLANWATGWIDTAAALARSGGNAPDAPSLVAALNVTSINLDCAARGTVDVTSVLIQNASYWPYFLPYLQRISGILSNISGPLLTVNANGANPMTQLGASTVGQIREQAGELYLLIGQYTNDRC